ncbi:MAG TPA: PEP-utilizing enzyme [Spirochaetia bacterium]|nr:PEP-utilizing enzyme [Spirochaetia bacterium]
MGSSKVLAEFLGDAKFPVTWKDEEEKSLFWFFDDNHCPNPISPMYFSLHGWWGPTCEYMFRRFDLNSGVQWIAKRINGYVYTAIVPRDSKDAEEVLPYYLWIMPRYASNFLGWWNERYLPEVKRNFEYIDGFDSENATLAELMIYLEEAIDIQERHFRLHWILNLAQFQASLNFGGVVNEIIGDVDQDMLGKVNVSKSDRNWDSLKELWKMKEAVRGSKELCAAFDGGDDAAAIRRLLEGSSAGRELLRKIEAYAKEFGYKAMYTHEYTGTLYVEDPTPVIGEIKSYYTSNYDYEAAYRACVDEQTKAIAYLRGKLESTSAEVKSRFEEALRLNLAMLPLTADHHFYFDQGTYARMRLVLLAVARKMVKEGLLDNPEDIMLLEYEQLRRYVGNPKGYDGQALINAARKAMAAARSVTPRDWVGTVTQQNMYEEPYHTLWGYPEKFEREQKSAETKSVKGEIRGLPASAGSVEGKARVVRSPSEFNDVQKGEIMVCVMTNPAWVVVFSKVAGLVTDAGGALSHSAVVAREFMIPAVVGTTSGTKEIKTGDMIRVDGNQGLVQIL